MSPNRPAVTTRAAETLGPEPFLAADLHSDDSVLVAAHGCISGDATVRTVRHPVRESRALAPEVAQVGTVRHPEFLAPIGENT